MYMAIFKEIKSHLYKKKNQSNLTIKYKISGIENSFFEKKFYPLKINSKMFLQTAL